MQGLQPSVGSDLVIGIRILVELEYSLRVWGGGGGSRGENVDACTCILIATAQLHVTHTSLEINFLNIIIVVYSLHKLSHTYIYPNIRLLVSYIMSLV